MATGAPNAQDQATSSAEKLSAAEKTLLVLETMIHEPRFSEVVAATGLAKATTHRILAVLSAHGFITMTEDGAYLPGPKVMALAGQAARSSRILEIAESYIDDLVAQVGCTAHLGTLNGDRVIYSIKAEPKDKPYQMPSRVGLEVPLNSTGIGKAILSGLNADQFERYLTESELSSRTVNTIDSPEALRREIEMVAERGYALDDEENVPGIICVAAPVHDNLGRVRHAISLSTITLEHTLAEIQAMAPQVVACAGRISDALGYLQQR